MICDGFAVEESDSKLIITIGFLFRMLDRSIWINDDLVCLICCCRFFADISFVCANAAIWTEVRTVRACFCFQLCFSSMVTLFYACVHHVSFECVCLLGVKLIGSTFLVVLTVKLMVLLVWMMGEDLNAWLVLPLVVGLSGFAEL